MKNHLAGVHGMLGYVNPDAIDATLRRRPLCFLGETQTRPVNDTKGASGCMPGRISRRRVVNILHLNLPIADLCGRASLPALFFYYFSRTQIQDRHRSAVRRQEACALTQLPIVQP